MLRNLLNVDVLSALVALVWAVMATYLIQIATLCSAQVAFAFALAAAARGLATARGNVIAATEGKNDDSPIQ